MGSEIKNNQISNNGALGLNFSGSGITNLILQSLFVRIRNNNIYNNTSGAITSGITIDENTTTLNPTYTSAAGNDYSIGTNTEAKGYPLGGTLPVGRSSTYSYVDPGAAQRQEAGGSTIIVVDD